MSDTRADARVEVEGRSIRLSNLDKVLYPETGTTKGEVIDYYSRIAPVLLPHLADRPLTVKRYPNGVNESFFFEKNAPLGTPEWVRTARLPAPSSTKDRDEIDYIIVEGLPTLVWLANLAALELHVPQWTVNAKGQARGVDRLVFDLDPGAPAGLSECRQVACLLRDLLSADRLGSVVKTSGSKGLQLYVGLPETEPGRTSDYARRLAERLAAEHPQLIVSRMTRSLRTGKVLVDWSQNNPNKTTVAPYSLRARSTPTVSTPVTWDDIESGADLVFTAPEVLSRVNEHGDLFEMLCTPGPSLP